VLYVLGRVLDALCDVRHNEEMTNTIHWHVTVEDQSTQPATVREVHVFKVEEKAQQFISKNMHVQYLRVSNAVKHVIHE
jgi:hypothetical protein